MPSAAVGVWLAAQTIIEILLCTVLIYCVFREKSRRRTAKHEQEKTERLIRTLDHLVKESEELEKKHLALVKLWERIEQEGEALEAHAGFYARTCGASCPANREKDPEKDGTGSGVACYEKTLRLIEKGMSPGDIAQEVGLPQGEVELILNLRGH